MSGLLARHRGRHCRHGSLTGWTGLVSPLRPVLDFLGGSRTPLALMPMAADDAIPFGPSPCSHPYTETPR